MITSYDVILCIEIGAPIILFLYFIYWLIKRTVENQNHWQHTFDGVDYSAEEFYNLVQAAIEKREIPHTSFSRVTYSQRGMFADKREYLHIVNDEFIYDVCAAPFAKGFFVSMWYVHRFGVLTKLIRMIPFLKNYGESKTYYQIDTDGMIHGAIQAGFSEAITEFTVSKGIRELPESQRQYFARLK